jgi:hypothetical protein
MRSNTVRLAVCQLETKVLLHYHRYDTPDPSLLLAGEREEVRGLSEMVGISQILIRRKR